MRGIAVSLILALCPPFAWPGVDDALAKAKLAPGLKLEVFSQGLAAPRSLDVSNKGHLAVGGRGQRVEIYVDVNGDASKFEHFVIPYLSVPNGVAWDGDDLLVAEITRVLRVVDPIESLQRNENVQSRELITGLPSSSHHGFRVINFGPDGRLYMALGVPCNICKPPDHNLMGVIRSYDLAARSTIVYAQGLRNSVGFDWHPTTGELWATDNGRDWLGDDLPHDELNRVHKEGLHFGYPYCHQGDFADPEYGSERPCSDFEPMTYGLGPHVAGLGLHFLEKQTVLPGGAVVALHGSWNRSDPIGYALMHLEFSDDGKQVTGYTPLVDWLDDNGEHYARPVDAAELSDGSIVVSDDSNNAIYRITSQ